VLTIRSNTLDYRENYYWCLEIIEDVPEVVDAIVRNARTGEIGDGKFLSCPWKVRCGSGRVIEVKTPSRQVMEVKC
jgi:nitrogen regulatory protein PII